MTELVFLSARAMAAAVRERRVSARALLEAHLARIARRDPDLGAFRRVLDESARRSADALDTDPPSEWLPLHGVPVAIKDTIDVAGVPTQNGTRSSEPPADADAEIVRRLRAAGAIVVGKTNLPELAAWPFTPGTSNPWARDRDPGGSSGGSAVAVAAGLAAIAIGDDLGGSIRVPAACTGIFGLKPRRGRVSMSPHASRIQGLGTYGPLTRNVDDAALVLDVIAGTTTPRELAPPRLRVGVSCRAPLPTALSPQVRASVAHTSELLRGLGHEVSPVDVPFTPALIVAFFPRYLRGMADELAGLREPSATDARTRSMARMGRAVPEWLLRRAHTLGATESARLDGLFDDIDVLLSPILSREPAPSSEWATSGALATLVAVARYSPFAGAWNVGGQPACVVPCPPVDGLPTAVQLVARDEQTLLTLAAEIERAQPFASPFAQTDDGGVGDRRGGHAEHGGERA